MEYGWNLQKLGNEHHLVKGNKSVPVSQCVLMCLLPQLPVCCGTVRPWSRDMENGSCISTTEGCLAKSLATTLPDPNSVQEVITIGHTCECTHEQLRFSVVDEPLDLLGPLHGSGTGSSSSQPVVVFDQPAVEQNDDDMEAVCWLLCFASREGDDM